jgi:hypothetical protein
VAGKNIEWKKVPPDAKIRLVGHKGSQSYVWNGKTIFWSGHESSSAQIYLNSLLRRRALKAPRSEKLPQIP